MDADSDIHIELDGRVWVVSLHGHQYHGTVERLDHEIEQITATGTTILLDLTEVSYVDGHLIAAITRWANRAQLSDHEALALVVGSSEHIASRGLDIALGVASRLPTFTTKDLAIAALQEASGP